jgi:hypothetical protein
MKPRNFVAKHMKDLCKATVESDKRKKPPKHKPKLESENYDTEPEHHQISTDREAAIGRSGKSIF